MVYTDGKSSWYLYDLQTGIQQAILPWLENVPGDPQIISIRWDQKGFSLILPEENRLYVFTNRSLDELSDRKAVVYQIDLPGLANSGDWGATVLWQSPENDLIALDLIAPGVNLKNYNIYQDIVPTWLYIASTDDQRLYSYCIDRKSLASGETGQTINPFAYGSIDGGYLAWTIYDPVTSLPLEVKVLELKSGKVATIDVKESKLEVVGWGEIPFSGK